MAQIDPLKQFAVFGVRGKIGKEGQPDPNDQYGIYRIRKLNGRKYHERLPFYEPFNPRTLDQMRQRDKMKLCVANWHSLDADAKKDFDNSAKGRKMSGFNYYLKKCLLETPSPMPTQSLVRVHLSAPYTTVSNPEVVPFDVIDIDLLGEFDNSSTFAFTPQHDGFYRISAQQVIFPVDPSAKCWMHIYVNGAPYSSVFFNNFVHAEGSFTLCDIVPLVAGDVVQLFYESGSGPGDGLRELQLSSLCIERL